MLLSIWFHTCPYWWRYFILVPLSLFLFTLLKYGFIQPELISNPNFQLIWSFTFVYIFIGLMDVFIFKKLRQHEFHKSIKCLLRDKRLFHRVAEEFKLGKQKSLPESEKLPRKIFFLASRLRSNLSDHQMKREELKLSIRLVDIFLISILLSIPLIYSFFDFIPEGQLEYNWMGTVITPHGFKDVNIFVWYLLSKICILIPLLLWFFTSQNWWRYAILSPIVIYIYQIWESFNTSNTQVDEIEFIKALPLLASIIFILLIFSHFVKYRSKLALLYDELTIEIDRLIAKISDSKVKAIISKNLLENLTQKDNSDNHLQRINDLKKLRQELIREINSGS